MAAAGREVRGGAVQVAALLDRQPTLLQRRMARSVTEPPQLILNCGQSVDQPIPQVIKIDRRSFASDPECACASAPLEMQGYIFQDTIGRGAYGVVYQAKCNKTGGRVALKVINTSKGHSIESAARKEYDVLKQMDHPNIVRVFDFHVMTSHAVLVMELFGGAPLSRVVQRAAGKCIAQEETRVLFRSLLQALDHLHSRGIVHRDVKPENLLVSDDLTDLRLIDFNTACFSRDLTELCASGTELYAAPEVLRGAAPTEANDIWGAGVCLHLMLCGRLPSICGETIESPEEGGPAELRVLGSRWKNVTELARIAVRRCLALRRSLRPSAAKMLEDEWVSGGEGQAVAKFAFEKIAELPGSWKISDACQWSTAWQSDTRHVDLESISSGTPTSTGSGDLDSEWEFAAL